MGVGPFRWIMGRTSSWDHRNYGMARRRTSDLGDLVPVQREQGRGVLVLSPLSLVLGKECPALLHHRHVIHDLLS